MFSLSCPPLVLSTVIVNTKLGSSKLSPSRCRSNTGGPVVVEGATDEVAAGGVVVVADADDAVPYSAVGGEPVDSLIGASCVDASFEPQPTVSQPIAAIMISARGLEPYGLTKNACPTLSPPIALVWAKLHQLRNAVRCGVWREAPLGTRDLWSMRVRWGSERSRPARWCSVEDIR